MVRGVAVLGSTGSIGTSTLDVIDHHRDVFRVVALTAGRNVDLLIHQARRFRPQFVAVASKDAARVVSEALDSRTRVAWGKEALVEAASLSDADTVVTAVVGALGIEATVAALRLGKRVALANKESLVAGGAVVMDALSSGNGEIIPVDSEHSAIFQCLHGERSSHVKRLILTASGGPFRTWSLADMEKATPQDALRHPTWNMGGKITIDSATLMNKGLEVIEAHWLFSMDYEDIDVIIHPQSIIHSMVEMIDGSTMAQLGPPDMKSPIQYALWYPKRSNVRHDTLSWDRMDSLTFEAPDTHRFPCLELAYHAGNTGGSAPVVLNAANEVAVEAFLEERIGFLDIARCIESVLERHDPVPVDDLEAVLATDAWARHQARVQLSAVG